MDYRLSFTTRRRSGASPRAWPVTVRGYTQRAGAPQQAADDLLRRVSTKDLFGGFTPKDGRIVLYTKEQQEADRKEAIRFLFRPQVFRAAPPGYSKNGELALVRFGFSWSGGRHGAEANCVLMLRQEEWSVIVRDTSRYL